MSMPVRNLGYAAVHMIVLAANIYSRAGRGSIVVSVAVIVRSASGHVMDMARYIRITACYPTVIMGMAIII